METKRMTYCDALRLTTAEEMRRDKNVYLIGEDVGRWGNLLAPPRGFCRNLGRSR